MVNRWKKKRWKRKRRGLKSDPQALRGQERMRKRVSAIQVQGIAKRQVCHWSRGDLIEKSHQVIRGRAPVEMTVSARDANGTLSAGLVSSDNGGERSPRAGRRGSEDPCQPPARSVPITRRWSMRSEIHMRDLWKRSTILGGVEACMGSP